MSEQEIEAIAKRVAELLTAKNDSRIARTVTQIEAARRIGCNLSTVKRMLKDGRLQRAGNGKVFTNSIQKVINSEV